MKTITIGFSNMWGQDADFTAEYFYRCFPFLRDSYSLVVTTEPDFMFYSVYSYVRRLAPKATRILISGECGDHFAEGGKMAPGVYDKDFYHYALTCAADNHHPNHIYMPQPMLMLNLHGKGLQMLIRDGSSLPTKEFFCDFIYGNPYSQDRREFMRLLSEYKHVECAGTVDRNVHYLDGISSHDTAGYTAKRAFQSRCRFSMAFENNYFPGYTSEKLSDPLVARSVPLYSGNPKVKEIFNPKAVINVDAFNNWYEAIEYIKYVDSNDDTYCAYLNEPPFIDNKIPDKFSDEVYLEFFDRIFK